MLAAVSGLDFRVYGLANNLRTVSRQLRCPPHARQCLLNVDSRHHIGANSILGGGRIALLAARAQNADVRFAPCVPPDRIQGWPPALSRLV
jgi:hypothetical protein